MELQTAFYVMAIIFMSLGIGILVSFLMLIWRAKSTLKIVRETSLLKISQVVPVATALVMWLLKRRSTKKT